MLEEVKWCVWRDENFGFQFGPNEQSKNKEVVEELDSLEEAKKALSDVIYH